jgi:SAM-dependent methyltransferase
MHDDQRLRCTDALGACIPAAEATDVQERFRNAVAKESRDWLNLFDAARLAYRGWCAHGLVPDRLDGMTVWDLGCGRGQGTAVYHFQGAAAVVATDVSLPPTIPSIVRDLPGVSFHHGELSTLARRLTTSPSLIIANCVTEHVSDLAGLFADCAAVLRPGGGNLLLTHDNYYQPVGHHDHGFLFMSPETNTVTFQGEPCWDSPLKCQASANHRAQLLRDRPGAWDSTLEGQLNPADCKQCPYWKRAQPWSHLLFQDDFSCLFTAPWFKTSRGVLNKITLFQLRQWLGEAGFRVLAWKPHPLNNAVPSQLLARFTAEDLTTFYVTVLASPIK